MSTQWHSAFQSPFLLIKKKGYFFADGGDLTFRHDIGGEDIGQTAAFHVLHDDPQVALVQETVHVIDDVLVLAIPHHQNLVDDQLFLRLLFQIHLLDRHRFARHGMVRRVHTTRRPFFPEGP